MAGRGMLFADGPTACPFVALESDRDRRADEPDPRHRCYAVPTPEPRALAHQREFCLSPRFGRCPIFQDWAIRAAARPVPLRPVGLATDASGEPKQPKAEPTPEPARGPEQLPAFGALPADEPAAPIGEGLAEPEVKPTPTIAPGAPSLAEPSAPAVERIPSQAADATPPSAEKSRARPRWTDDWPPSASTAAGAASGAWLSPPGSASPSTAPESAAGSSPPAGRPRAGYIPPPSVPDSSESPPSSPAAPPDAEAPMPAFLAGRTAQRDPAASTRPRRPQAAKPSKRDEWSAQRADLIPAWERERYSAFPTMRTRLGMGDSDALLGRLTRILGIIALVALAVALLILAPGFFAGAPAASPTPTASASPSGPSPSPTASPSPTLSFGTYTVRSGDSLTAIAVDFGLLPCQIMAANPEITNPNLIQIGQVLRIPPDDFALDCANPSPASSP